MACCQNCKSHQPCQTKERTFMNFGQTTNPVCSQLQTLQDSLTAAVADPTKASLIPGLTSQIQALAPQCGATVSTVSTSSYTTYFLIAGAAALAGVGFLLWKKKHKKAAASRRRKR